MKDKPFDKKLTDLQNKKQFLTEQLGEAKLNEVATVFDSLSKEHQIRPYYMKEIVNYWYQISLLP